MFKKRYFSTAIIIILCVFSVYLLINLLPLTLDDFMPKPENSDPSTVIGTAVGGIFLTIFGTVGLFLLIFGSIITAAIALVLSICNLKAPTKQVRITNIVLCAISGILFIIPLIKLITLYL